MSKQKLKYSIVKMIFSLLAELQLYSCLNPLVCEATSFEVAAELLGIIS